ncbi:MAG: DUF308 domain-containing protein [Clostridia bacterium]|nr:DUF308 domain-containing protein [Clostridia bacterium]
MLRKAYTPLSLFLWGVMQFVLGILLLTRPEQTIAVLPNVLAWLLWIAAGDAWVKFFFRRKETKVPLLQAVGLTLLAVNVSAVSFGLQLSISVIFGIWILLNAVGKFLYAFQLRRTGTRGFLTNLIQGIVYLLFGISLLSRPIYRFTTLAVVLGVYCLVSSFSRLVDAVREALGTDIGGKRVRQRIRIKPPVLLTTLMPMRLLQTLDDPDEEAEIAQWTRRETVLENAEPDLEIFLHLGKNVAFGMGHMDIALGDTVYAYGNYNAEAHKLFGAISEGILFTAERESYLRFSTEHENKRLIGYGVVLTKEQKEAIQKSAKTLMEGCSRWYPQEEGSETKEMERLCDAKYYRIEQGPFQVYNVLTTNCVAVANLLCGSAGVDLMSPQGIITPGTYCEFLDRQFRRPKSIVISRTVYR